MSSNAGHPPARGARLALLVVMLLATGCALVMASFEPRPATAVWVGR